MGRCWLRNQLALDLDAAMVVVEDINLSERLAPISSEVGQVDRQEGILVGARVLRTLVYLFTHQYQAAENLFHSPLALLSKMHRLMVRQFTWVLLRARARVEAWGD